MYARKVNFNVIEKVKNENIEDISIVLYKTQSRFTRDMEIVNIFIDYVEIKVKGKKANIQTVVIHWNF